MRRLLCVFPVLVPAGCLRGRFQPDRPNHYPSSAVHRHRHQRRHRSGGRRRQIRDRATTPCGSSCSTSSENKGPLIGTSVGRAPLTFTVGTVDAGGVIPGFDRGRHRHEGGRRPPAHRSPRAGVRRRGQSGAFRQTRTWCSTSSCCRSSRACPCRSDSPGCGSRRGRWQCAAAAPATGPGRRRHRSRGLDACRGATSSTPGRGPTSRAGSTTLAAAAGAIRSCRPTPAAPTTPPCATARS